LKKKITKKTSGVDQGIGLEFKPQYHKKEGKMERKERREGERERERERERQTDRQRQVCVTILQSWRGQMCIQLKAKQMIDSIKGNVRVIT
jgi:hypothetical protein